MKKIIMIIAVAAVAAVANANPVIYVVDVAQVHKNYYKTKSVQEQLKSSMDTTNSELQRMGEQHKALEAELAELQKKAANPALSEEAKKDLQDKEFLPKLTNMRQLEQTMLGLKNQAEQKLRQQQQEVIAAHRKEIVDVIAKLAADKKADFILEKNAVYFSKPASDITEDVISLLNANAPKN